MNKITKIFLVLLVLFISISAVSAEGNFTALKNDIDTSTTAMEINQNYVYDNTTDYNLNHGILIDKSNFAIDGKGHTIDASNQAVRNYQIKWRNWQIKGAVIGLIISVIAAAAIWLILHFSSKEKTSSVLFIITTAIDIVLILDSVMLYRLFSHLL